MIVKKDLTKPFMNLWPEYEDMHDFKSAYEIEVYISQNRLNEVISFTSTQITDL